MSRTYKDHPDFKRNMTHLRCFVGRKLRNKKKSKGHKSNDCWICW